MAKYVIYKNHTDGAWYFTTAKNYNAYIQNARENKRIDGLDNPLEFIGNMCKWYNDKPENYRVIY